MKIYVVYCYDSNEGGDCSCSWRSAIRFFKETKAIDYCQQNNWSKGYPYTLGRRGFRIKIGL